MIIDPATLGAFTFPADAPAGATLTKIVSVNEVVASNVEESGSFTATLGSEVVSSPVAVTLVAPTTPTFEVQSTPSVSLEITNVALAAGRTDQYRVTVVATKL